MFNELFSCLYTISNPKLFIITYFKDFLADPRAFLKTSGFVVFGGLIGGIRISDTINITNCPLDGAVEGSDNAIIEGKNKAGGIFGIARERTANVSSVVIKNYDIIQSYEANYITGAGGISGHLYGNTLNLKDVLVSDCSITSRYTSFNNSNKGTGGLIGVTTNGGSVTGYNI